MLGAAQIAKGEFLHLFQKCMPPGGWPRRVAVANSAGPDSSCLLYLISDLVREAQGRRGLPSEVCSIHINHNLQQANAEMVQRASKMAEDLGVPHYTIPIPWSEKPFPHRPHCGEPIEEIARAARQNRLLYGLLRAQAHCIAFGHHADDQVETSIMRIIMGSGELGIAGMRSVRRWGMGSGGLDAAGVAGMNHWIIRPLLEVPKDRILATCAANNLDFVTDQTNFQPALTLRNHVRKYLSERERRFELPGTSTDLSEQCISEKEKQIESAIERLSQYAQGNRRLCHLREAVRQAGYQVNIIDMRASYALDECLLSSPPSTILLSNPRLKEVTDNDIRVEVARRILRYVSPRPWGAPTAVAGGSRIKLGLLVSRIWEEPATSKAFSLGSRVRWQPVVIRSDGTVRMDRPRRPGEYDGLLAVRDTPWSLQRIPRDNEPTNAVEDYTDQIVEASNRQHHTLELLYDARFCIQFDLEKMPEEVLLSLTDLPMKGRILVKPDSKWWLPKVVWQRERLSDEILAEYKIMHHRDWTVDAKPTELAIVPWMRMYFIRTIKAL